MVAEGAIDTRSRRHFVRSFLHTMSHESSSPASFSGGVSRRDLVAASAATLAVMPFLSTAHAQEATPAETPVTGGTLRVGVQGDPSELDPHLTVLNAAGVVIDLVYDGLVKED